MELSARLKTLGSKIKEYFNMSAELIPQEEAEASMRSAVSFRGSQLLVLIFAILIASLGLNTNSIPVIIGAMIISPLMGPIMGMGLGIGIGDFMLLRRGLKNILTAIAGSVIASGIYFLMSPAYEGTSQLLARTSPTIYDVFIALFGGAAGIISVACRGRGSVMPGVAIATSLMPPLCTAGYGLATLQSRFFFGALYLFFINAMFILFATWIGVKLMRYKKVPYEDERRARRVRAVVYTLLGLTVAVSAYMTFVMIRTNIFYTKATEFIQNDMVFPNTQVLNHKEYIKAGKRHIDVTLIGEELPKDSLRLAMLQKLDSAGLGGTQLNIRQGFSFGNSDLRSQDNVSEVYKLMQAEIVRKQGAIDSLRQLVRDNVEFTDDGSRIAPEIKVLFPQVRDIALSHMVINNIETHKRDTVNMLFVNSSRRVTEAEKQRMGEFVSVRLKTKGEVLVSVNPASIPWPR